jgi:ankyrin repeat protein
LYGLAFTKINTDNTRGKPYNQYFNRGVSFERAPSDSEWGTAIQRNDCKTLLKLLEDNPELWKQTVDGRSVLHVAIMQGCTELVHKLHKSEDSSPFNDLWEYAKDSSMQNASALDIWRIMDAGSAERSSDDYISAHPTSAPLGDEEDVEMSRLRKVMTSYQEPFQMDMDDVNFNFDVRSELLVHMACSRLRNLVTKKFESDPSVSDELSKIVTFISKILKELKDKNLLQKLFKQTDARGRTILQVFIASKYAIANENKTWVEDKFQKLLDMLPPECVNARDSAGRTVLHWAVAYNSCWAVKILVESGKADLCATCKTTHCENVTALHLAVIYDCDDCARHLLESNCNLDQMSLSMGIDISFGSHSQKKWCPLDLAIIMAQVKLARRMRQVKVCFTNLIPYS